MIRSWRLVALACAVAASAGAQDSVASQGKLIPVTRELTALIEHERADKGIAAVSIALVDGQRIVWARGFGWADSAAGVRATASTVYRVGGVATLFTDLAITRLVEQGKLDLDVPVRRYLPDFHPTNPFGGDITLRELMSHRAGLTREPPVGSYVDDGAPSLAATVASLNGTTLVYKPGTHTKQSDAGIAVLGYVLEKTQGESFYSYLQRAVVEPMRLEHTALSPTPAITSHLAKAEMWTLDGRRTLAPTFQLGIGPSQGMYSTVVDLARFLQLAGHRSLGEDGSVYGFATSLLALPSDSLSVVVTATLDGANGVTSHIAQTALHLMVEARKGVALAAVDTTMALPRGRALALMGRYENSNATVDLNEYEGRLFLTPMRGGPRIELRAPTRASDTDLVVDDALAFGQRLRVIGQDVIVFEGDTLRRRPTPDSHIVPVANTKPATAPSNFAAFTGQYGQDHDVLYLREKDGKLNALVDWFFEYPLEAVSRDVYRFPGAGRYDGEVITFTRGPDGSATVATVGGVAFKRRELPADNDHVNFRITAVRPPSELRAEALAARPPVESRKLASDLVELRSLDTTIKYDIRYATSNNFMGTPFYTSAHAFMQRPAAEAVVRASAELRRLGYGLLIHDAYRPWYVTKMFWDGTPPDKHVFVADPSQGSRHNRGCAVDLTLYDLKTGAPIRMTGGYDEMTDRSYPLYPGGTSLQRWSRDLLRHAMEAQGFNVFEAEWWHFDFQAWRDYPIGNLTFEQLAAAARTSPRSLKP